MTLGESIKNLRKNKGLTQKQLAQKGNISRSYLGDVEGDRYNPSLKVLQIIANVLETSIQQLIPNDININNTEPTTEDETNELELIFEKLRKIDPSEREKISKIIDIFIEN